MESIDRPAIKKEVLTHISHGNLAQAEELRKRHNLSALELKESAEKGYYELLKKKEMQLAIKVCEQYNLPIELRIEALNSQFRHYVRDKEFDKAIEWGVAYKLPATEINNVGAKAFEYALNNREIEKAIALKHKYEIPDSLVSAHGLQWFNILYDKKQYIKALQLGREFDISVKRVLTAGIRGYFQILTAGKIDVFIELEKQFNILGDRDINRVEEGDIKSFISIFIKSIVRKYLAEEKAEKLSKIVDALEIFDKKENNPLLAAMVKQVTEEVVVVHNNLMDGDRFPDAHRLVHSFRLLTDSVPAGLKTKLIQSAENAHHRLIQNQRLTQAKALKDNYELFSKNIITDSLEKVASIAGKELKTTLESGDVDNAEFIIREYNLPKPFIRDTAAEAIEKLLRTRKFIEAFEVKNRLKIPSDDTAFKDQAKTAFEDAYSAGQMELASNLGQNFKIRDKRVQTAALSIWQKQMDAGRYSQAVEYKKLHSIPRSMTTPVVRETYKELVNRGQMKQAIYLRNEYRVNISIFDWLRELLKKTFGG